MNLKRQKQLTANAPRTYGRLRSNDKAQLELSAMLTADANGVAVKNIIMKIIVTKKREKIIVDDDIYEKVGGLKWYLNQSFAGKWIARRNKIPNSNCCYLHHYVLGRKPKKNESAFFINGNNFDYRKGNLEFRSHDTQKKCKYIGVTKMVRILYRARVWHNGRQVKIGMYHNEISAVRARNEYCKKHKLTVKTDDVV